MSKKRMILDSGFCVKSINPVNVSITDQFWKQRMEIARTKVIPYQWEALNDRIEGADPSYAIHNFKTAAAVTARGDKKGNEKENFGGFPWQDSDLAKWLEAVGHILTWHKDEELETIMDETIDLICDAQQPDGYIDTYYIVTGLDKRWTNLRDNHELYIFGHMLEAAIAYYEATRKDKFLNAMIRFANCISDTFGTEPGKLKGYPGHEVAEMALVRLYEITGNKEHLKLAEYFINQRGQQPYYFDDELIRNGGKPGSSPLRYQYSQAHKPVREQETAEGHAVRAVYLYSGMADVARHTKDQSLLDACERIWDNITKKQMYITGNIGSTRHGEAFTFDYDLPNDTVYGETCATIGLIFFAKRMLEIKNDRKYSDVMERCLYNGSISGISLDGTRFFYVNPLEVNPELCVKNHQYDHVKPERQKWFGCACCPPNIARLLASVGSYIYTENDNTIYTHLYIANRFKKTFGEQTVIIDTETSYPWDEKVRISFQMEQSIKFSYALRIPGWCKAYKLLVNGNMISYEIQDGYAYINRTWNPGDIIEFTLSMPVQVIAANPHVRANAGKISIMRGPICYCLEEIDNGKELHQIRINPNTEFKAEYEDDLLNGLVTLKSLGERQMMERWESGELYMPLKEAEYKSVELKWVPYYAWANRGVGEMTVWVRSTKG